MPDTFENAFGGILSVPRNADGLHSLQYDMHDPVNVTEWELSDAENSSLMATYHDINDRIGTIIDYCEDEFIPLESIPDALAVVSDSALTAEHTTLLSALQKLREALELASECSTCVWLFL